LAVDTRALGSGGAASGVAHPQVPRPTSDPVVPAPHPQPDSCSLHHRLRPDSERPGGARAKTPDFTAARAPEHVNAARPTTAIQLQVNVFRGVDEVNWQPDSTYLWAHRRFDSRSH
jgi:hypothetical protein